MKIGSAHRVMAHLLALACAVSLSGGVELTRKIPRRNDGKRGPPRGLSRARREESGGRGRFLFWSFFLLVSAARLVAAPSMAGGFAAEGFAKIRVGRRPGNPYMLNRPLSGS